MLKQDQEAKRDGLGDLPLSLSERCHGPGAQTSHQEYSWSHGSGTELRPVPEVTITHAHMDSFDRHTCAKVSRDPLVRAQPPLLDTSDREELYGPWSNEERHEVKVARPPSSDNEPHSGEVWQWAARSAFLTQHPISFNRVVGLCAATSLTKRHASTSAEDLKEQCTSSCQKLHEHAHQYTSTPDSCNSSHVCDIYHVEGGNDEILPLQSVGYDELQDPGGCSPHLVSMAGFMHTPVPASRITQTIAAVFPENLPGNQEGVYVVLESVGLSLSAVVHRVDFDKLDDGDGVALETFYNSNVAVVDLSEVGQLVSTLSYHLGVRESIGNEQCIVLYHDRDAAATKNMKNLCTACSFLPYYIKDDETWFRKDDGDGSSSDDDDCPIDLRRQLYTVLAQLHVESRKNYKEAFLRDLRSARRKLRGEGLCAALNILRSSLNEDKRLFCNDVILELELAYRDLQNYTAMVELYEMIPELSPVRQSAVQQHYAFALNRRNGEGDRGKALAVLEEMLTRKENQVPDMLCLQGRIYKDVYVESSYEDSDALKQAVRWYGKGYEVEPNVYAGINLATLLVVSGHKFKESVRLQQICMTLNNLIGKKGLLESLEDFWDLATFLELHILGENYYKANVTSEKIFHLNPAAWSVKSTLNNITLIMMTRETESRHDANLQLLDFWLEFFKAIFSSSKLGFANIPVLSLEDKRTTMKQSGDTSYVPMYVSVEDTGHEDTGGPYLQLWYASDGGLPATHIADQCYPISDIRKISLYKRDDRCLFLFVRQNASDYQLYFPSAEIKQRIHDHIISLGVTQTPPEEDGDVPTDIKFEYDVDQRGDRVRLGEGSFGVVYQATERDTDRKIAVKEVPQRHEEQVEPLHDEIRLHCHFRHPNIVRYYGSRSDDIEGLLLIFMEFVPGGSLAHLLRKSWGPLTDMTLIGNYAKQIADGLRYLHKRRIVHRDIKGDNVLVNTFTGVLKISDFGTTKRLSQVNPKIESLKGTMQFMAPEVIDIGQRGYGPKADVWSLGCTVIEMLTGKPPFIDLGMGPAVLFKVGTYKEHPPIPDSASAECQAFCLRCFEIDTEARASCDDLLQDPFVANVGSPFDGPKALRSVSAPGGMETEDDASDSLPPVQPAIERSQTLPPDVSSAAAKETGERPKKVFTLSDGDADPASTSTGITLSKRDKIVNVRVQKLLQILHEDAEIICDRWEALTKANIPPPIPSRDQLDVFYALVTEYVHLQDYEGIVVPMNKFMQENEESPELLKSVRLCFFRLGTLIQESLRNRGLKPHWQFTLEQVVTEAIQSANDGLLPGTSSMSVDARRSLSGASSGVFSTTVDDAFNMDDEVPIYSDEVSSLQVALRDALQTHLSTLRIMQESTVNTTAMINTAAKHSTGARGMSVTPQKEKRISFQSRTETEMCDSEVEAWLKTLNFDIDVINVFALHRLTYMDVMECMTRSDLQDLGLKVGPRCRIWHSICHTRQECRAKAGTASSSADDK